MKNPNEVDLYRQTSVRYLGYANELGEAFRSFIGSKWVNFTYGVASLYVLADTADKSIKSYKEHEEHPHRLRKVTFATVDTLIWQFLASIIIPGVTINRICYMSNYFLKKSNKLPDSSRKWVVTSIGLIAIPLIIKPIDHFVDDLMDSTMRKYRP